MKSIGIDLGTTTISAVVLDTASDQAAESRTIPNDTGIRTANAWERLQDAEQILQKAEALLADLLALHPDVCAIGITGQMHGIVYLNEAGDVISPLYTWQDGRGNLPAAGNMQEGRGTPGEGDAPEAADSKTNGSAAAKGRNTGKSASPKIPVGAGSGTLTEEIRERTGLTTYTGYGLVTHLWLARAGLVPPEAAALCTIGDALGVKLTGRRAPLLHAGNAAGLGFYDAHLHRFHTKALAEMEADPRLLPDTTTDFVSPGVWHEIPVCIALGDNQAAFLGAAGLKDDVIALNMGTGGQVSVMSDTYCEIPGIETRPLTRDRWLLVGASLCGGYAYALLEQFYRSCLSAFGADPSGTDIYAVMERLAREGKGAGLQVRTAFLGTRENPDLSGAVSGIRAGNFTPAALTRGVLEGMAGELYGDYVRMQQAAGIRAERIIASGNGLRRNPVLREICEDMFGLPIELSSRTEEAACGAAYAAVRAIR